MRVKITGPSRNILIFTIPLLIFMFALVVGRLAEGSQQFSDLAKSFLHGKTYFLQSIGGYGQDPVFWHGKMYWSDGPFPAILLMPFVAVFSLFQAFFYQGYIQWFFVVGVFYFIFKLAQKLSYKAEDALVLAFGFTLGSVFLGVSVVSSSWLFAQVLTTFLLLWSLYEFYNHRRWRLIGLICGFIFMTRPTATPIILFFILELWQDKKAKPKLLNNFIKLALPLLISIILIGLYNLIRFQNPLNGGYAYQILYTDSSISRSYGIFSLAHIPANLYSLLLRGPVTVLKSGSSWILKFPYIENNPYGMSIFITSPYFLYILSQKWSAFDGRAKNLLIATAASALLVLTYYGIGIDQFGYRYSLDFLPELFLVFMIVYKKSHQKLSKGMRFLLLGSGVLNLYLVISFMLLA